MSVYMSPVGAGWLLLFSGLERRRYWLVVGKVYDVCGYNFYQLRLHLFGWGLRLFFWDSEDQDGSKLHVLASCGAVLSVSGSAPTPAKGSGGLRGSVLRSLSRTFKVEHPPHLRAPFEAARTWATQTPLPSPLLGQV